MELRWGSTQRPEFNIQDLITPEWCPVPVTLRTHKVGAGHPLPLGELEARLGSTDPVSTEKQITKAQRKHVSARARIHTHTGTPKRRQDKQMNWAKGE